MTAADHIARCGLDLVAAWRQGLEPRCERHSHDGFELVLHPSGSGRTVIPGGEAAFAPGSAVLYAPGVVHEQWASGRGEEWCLLFRPRRPLPRVPDLVHVAACDDPYVLGESALLTRIPGEERASRRDELSLRSTALVLRVLALGSGLTPARLPPARRHAEAAREWLRANFREPHCLADVAAALGVGVDHLRHCFRRETGTGMARYVAGLRIAHAKDLLAHSRLPLRRIAVLCGYANERYLCRVFRRIAGAPPSRFRGA